MFSQASVCSTVGVGVVDIWSEGIGVVWSEEGRECFVRGKGVSGGCLTTLPLRPGIYPQIRHLSPLD